MADGKKIKLPQHLQLDSVSPATRLLEKRRLMYEVQKAFDDQKEEFLMKEKRFKLQEQELREKDVLIQENLIKFSTFLQQQNMRKNKDVEVTNNELQKIAQHEADIQRLQKTLYTYQRKAKKIEMKVEQMKKYEHFLDRVKEANPDEFTDVIDILSRHQQLKTKNLELQQKQQEYTEQYELISKQLAEEKNKQEMKQTLAQNKMSTQQQQMEEIDKSKGILLAQQDEKTKENSKKITETGQMLMTIDNLYYKCKQHPDVFPLETKYVEGFPQFDGIKDFDVPQMRGRKAEIQLKILIQAVKHFKQLKQVINVKKKDLRSTGVTDSKIAQKR